MRTTRLVRIVVAALVILPSDRARADPLPEETRPQQPDMYAFVYVRGFVPVHAVDDVPGGGGFGWTEGWWGPRIRVGWNLELGKAPCSICAPYSSSWVTVVTGADLSFDLWQHERWSLVGGVRPRVMIAAVDSDRLSAVPIDNRPLFQPQISLALWADTTSVRLRTRGWRTAWVLELQAEQWLHGGQSSPAAGLSVGFFFGGCC